jgi:ABC-type transporter Mla MlaB component
VRIERRASDDTLTFLLFGRLEGLAARHLQRVLAGAVCDGSNVTLDLAGVSACDDEGAAALVSLKKRARDASGQLVVSEPPATLVPMLERAGVLGPSKLAS